jgi:uncharacterized delta-60 repeat protein
VAQQPDGKLIAIGYTRAGIEPLRALVTRVNPDGTPDESFGSGGVVSLTHGGPVNDVLVQPDGKIVVVGYSSPAADFVITRLTQSGTPDPSFGAVDATIRIDIDGADFAEAVALQRDGKLVVAGSSNASGISVVRLNANGLPDVGFGTGGGQLALDPAAGDYPNDILVQPDGKIVVIGAAAGDGFLVTRLTSNGSYDEAFGNGEGVVGFSFPGRASAHANKAVLQANGKLVLAGSTYDGNSALMAVARLQPGGSLDTTFGRGGSGRQSLSGGRSEGFSVALRSDGRIVVAGDNTTDALVVRLEGDPQEAGGGPAAGTPGAPGGPGGPGGSGGGGGGRGITSVPRCAGKRATIVGSARSDRLKGTRRADVIVSLGGNDRIAAGGGKDIVCGGNGNDRLDGGTGNDRLFGQSGRDALGGATGNDLLDGGVGNDALGGGPGKDSLLGQAGQDRLTGGPGKGDRCMGNAGRDQASCERGQA